MRKPLSNVAFNCNLRHYSKGALSVLPSLIYATQNYLLVGRCRLTPGFRS